MAGKVLVWNGVSSATVPELVIGQAWRPLLGASGNIHTRIPGRPGTWVTPGKPGLRSLKVSAYVQAEDFQARRDAIEAVSDWLDVEGEAELTISDMPGRYYLATLTSLGEADEWRETGVFELQWDIQPYSYDVAISEETWTSDSDDNHVFNPGVLAPVWPIIYITPTNGTLTDFTLEGNGDTLTVTGVSVASGQTITISSLVPIVAYGIGYDTNLTGIFDQGGVVLNGVSGTFITLMPGSNNIHFVKTGGTATSFTILVRYRKTYRS